MAKPRPTKRPPRPLRTAGQLALIAVLLVVCFQPVAEYFFAQDDFILIANVAHDRSATVANTLGGASDLFRPLTKVVYFDAMHRLFGLEPGPYHAVSIAVHLVNFVLLFLLLRKLRSDRLSSLVTASFFAFHLGFFDVLAWISCIQQLLGQTFMLAALIFGIRAVETRRALDTAPALVAYVLAILSLEQTYALPLILFIHACGGERHAPARSRAIGALRDTGAFVAVMVAYLAYMAFVKGVPGEGPYRYAFGTNVATNLLTYLDWALGISVVMPFIVDVKSTGLTGAHVLLAAMVVYNLAKGRKRIVVLSCAYYLLTILPVLFLEGHAFHLHNYVPAVGIALLAAPIVEDFLETVRKWRPSAAPAAAVGIIALLAIVCFTKVRANETNFLRPDLPLPQDFVLRRAVIARNAFDDLEAKTSARGIPRRLFLVFTSQGSWYRENVVAALGRGSALRLFYARPDLDVRFHDRGDTLSDFDPRDSSALFFDHMGRFYTPKEMEAERSSPVRPIDPDQR